MTDFDSYDEVAPLRELYYSLFNDLALLAGSHLSKYKKQPKLYAKYGKKLENLVKNLEKDLQRHCRELDLKLAANRQ